MQPLSDLLITVLDTALKTRATHVDVLADDQSVHWFHGDELVGTAQVPDGGFALLASELQTLGAKPTSNTRITIQSPAGPITFIVDLTSAVLMRLVLRDAATAAAEATFGGLMVRGAELGANRVVCTNNEARFSKNDQLIESVTLVAEATALLIAHGKQLGGLTGESRSGRAILFGGGKKQVLHIELVEDGVSFTLEPSP